MCSPIHCAIFLRIIFTPVFTGFCLPETFFLSNRSKSQGHFSPSCLPLLVWWVARTSSFHPGSVQFSSVVQSCPTLNNPMDCSMPGFPVHHIIPEVTQTHVLWVGDAIQRSHPLSPPSFPAFNLSQHQGLFKWVSSSHQVAKVLELQLQHQSFQGIFRTDFL